MDIIYHITFTEDESPTLINYFNKNNIEYKYNGFFYLTDLSEQNPHWLNVLKIIQKDDVSYTVETIFSKDELNSAEWLRVRSCWKFDYPQPEDSYESITYSLDSHCAECGSGLLQETPFRLKKEPKWGKRNFLMVNWIEDELFLSSKAKSLLESKKIQNISFLPVLNKSGNQEFTDVHQLIIHNFLPYGFVDDLSCIQQTYSCPRCNSIKYHPNGKGKFVFHKEIFSNASPIVKSSELFGWGGVAMRLIIVNQFVYQLLKQNHLEHSLVFEPIELI